ncbi:hypothetical protein [Kordiimonas aestuarii]|uniref:hypothetical protein n=1 Tax=Kordiimonas aestuarii TaxID=1005925 RepID=UPI0021CF2DAF|nr:hypothetical protein [Kordiimonas aestuarii]
MTISAGRISAVAVASVLFFHPVYADDSERLMELRASPPISADAIQQEQLLATRYSELKAALKQKGLSKEEKKALKAEYKTVKSEYKSIQKANKKASKSYDKEVKKLEKSLRKEYGMGPYPAETQLYVASRPEPLQPYYRSLFIEGERNAVLNFNRLGLAALELGYLDHAEWAFDRSIDKIEAIYADNEQAKAAKSKFSAEDVKEFKGEPYERAMAYYYRGLIYLSNDDYENARAMFRSGEYQDTVSEAEDFQADFALMNYLDGWALHCQGRSGEEAFAKAADFRQGLSAPAPEHNVLFLTELGSGPVKYGDGEYREILKFRTDDRFHETAATALAVNMDSGEVVRAVDAYPVEDVYFQASTRGGRPVDGILEGKAQFKETTAAVGNVMSTAGTVTAMAGLYSGDGDAALIGAGIALIGGLFGAASEAAKPEADTRQWDNLPRFVTVATDQISNVEQYGYAAEFKGTGGAIPDITNAALVAGGDACSVVWTRSRSATAVGESSPGARLDWKTIRKQPDAVQKMDVAFRTWLADETPGETLGAE